MTSCVADVLVALQGVNCNNHIGLVYTLTDDLVRQHFFHVYINYIETSLPMIALFEICRPCGKLVIYYDKLMRQIPIQPTDPCASIREIWATMFRYSPCIANPSTLNCSLN